MNKVRNLRVSMFLLGLAAVLVVGAARVSWAAFDAFLRIDGIKGESQDQAHKDWIEIESWSFGAARGTEALRALDSEAKPESVQYRETMPKAGGGRAEQKQHQPIVITKRKGAASPVLTKACASGQHFPRAILEVGGRQYVLTDVVLSSYSISSGGDRPTESFSLSFMGITTNNK